MTIRVGKKKVGSTFSSQFLYKTLSKLFLFSNLGILSKQRRRFFNPSCLYTCYILSAHFPPFYYQQPLPYTYSYPYIAPNFSGIDHRFELKERNHWIFLSFSHYLASADFNLKRFYSKGTKKGGMPRGVKKENLPSKICLICNRPFTWRKKWERCWDEVQTCSKSCNSARKMMKRKEDKLESREITEDENRNLQDTYSPSFSSTIRFPVREFESNECDIAKEETFEKILDIGKISLGDSGFSNTMNGHRNQMKQFAEEVVNSSDESEDEGGKESTLTKIEKEINGNTEHHDMTRQRRKEERKARKKKQKELKKQKREYGFVESSNEKNENMLNIEDREKKRESEKIEINHCDELANCAKNSKGNSQESRSIGEKPCDICTASVNLLIRCQIDSSKEWKMVCGSCWKGVSGGVPDGDAHHPYYRYGGLWKNKNKYRRR